MTLELPRYNLLRVAVARDDGRLHTLQKTSELPCSRATLGVTAQALLSHDRDGIALGTADVSEHIVPDRSLVLLLQSEGL